MDIREPCLTPRPKSGGGISIGCGDGECLLLFGSAGLYFYDGSRFKGAERTGRHRTVSRPLYDPRPAFGLDVEAWLSGFLVSRETRDGLRLELVDSDTPVAVAWTQPETAQPDLATDDEVAWVAYTRRSSFEDHGGSWRVYLRNLAVTSP